MAAQEITMIPPFLSPSLPKGDLRHGGSETRGICDPPLVGIVDKGERRERR
jgi:hypothetical protein